MKTWQFYILCGLSFSIMCKMSHGVDILIPGVLFAVSFVAGTLALLKDK